MKDLGPLGVLLDVAYAVAAALVVALVVGAVWQIGVTLVTLGWPLLVLAGLLPAGAAGYALRRHAAPPRASLPPARVPLEQFCDQCGSRLAAGCCPYCGV